VKAFLSDADVLMARIPDLKPKLTLIPKDKAGADKYHGEVADGYDAKREEQPKWHEENRIVREMLSDLPSGTSVVDVPVGTGRFIPLYEELGFHVHGLDISDDMLRKAAEKAKADTTYLRLGDARSIDAPDGSYDVAMCIRLMRWLETKETQLRVISELIRVSRKRVIFNVRTETGPLPLTHDAVDAFLSETGWRVARREQIIDDFTMFQLEPK
jgi:ubiquinone/menaquinone biosynthesis C-methylase UbiE